MSLDKIAKDVDFFLKVLANSSIETDWHAVRQATGISNANNTWVHFKVTTSNMMLLKVFSLPIQHSCSTLYPSLARGPFNQSCTTSFTEVKSHFIMSELAEKDIQFILASLSCNEEALKINWHTAASRTSMTQARNWWATCELWLTLWRWHPENLKLPGHILAVPIHLLHAQLSSLYPSRDHSSQITPTHTSLPGQWPITRITKTWHWS